MSYTLFADTVQHHQDDGVQKHKARDRHQVTGMDVADGREEQIYEIEDQSDQREVED